VHLLEQQKMKEYLNQHQHQVQPKEINSIFEEK
jgi:hypothetical protein